MQTPCYRCRLGQMHGYPSNDQLWRKSKLGNVRMVHTDWEDEAWERSADRAGEVLKRPIPTPGGLKCSERRRGVALAWDESRALEHDAPAPAQSKPARSERI